MILWIITSVALRYEIIFGKTFLGLLVLGCSWLFTVNLHTGFIVRLVPKCFSYS